MGQSPHQLFGISSIICWTERHLFHHFIICFDRNKLCLQLQLQEINGQCLDAQLLKHDTLEKWKNLNFGNDLSWRLQKVLWIPKFPHQFIFHLYSTILLSSPVDHFLSHLHILLNRKIAGMIQVCICSRRFMIKIVPYFIEIYPELYPIRVVLFKILISKCLRNIESPVAVLVLIQNWTDILHSLTVFTAFEIGVFRNLYTNWMIGLKN